ncbi:MAG: hypothetical protein AB1726_06230, partial [Planctomycetota bacterium]
LPLLGLPAAGFLPWWRRVIGDVATFARLGQRARLRALLARQRDELARAIEALAGEVRRGAPP